MSENKNVLRKLMKEELAQVDEGERLSISRQLQEVLFQSDLWKNAKTIGVYLSLGTEWDTRNIVEEAFKAGINVVIPKTVPDVRRMDFYQITDQSQAEQGHFGLYEPIVEETTYVDKDKIDLLIVPGLIFSKDGYRIGFGGGYYDRFLADFNHKTVSLISSKQLKESVPIREYDIPVDHIITENGFVK